MSLPIEGIEKPISRRHFLGTAAVGLVVGMAPPRPASADDEPDGLGVVVLDDCDPHFKVEGAPPQGDRVRLLTAGGKELWSIKTLKIRQVIGANHGVAVDPKRGRIYLREVVKNRVTSLDTAGKVVYRQEGLKASALAIDPRDGYLWCTSSNPTDLRTVVLNPEGKIVAIHELGGYDLAFDPVAGAFWIVGRGGFHKIDRAGKSLIKDRRVPTFACVSVAAAPFGDGAWIVERANPRFPGSIDQLIFVSNDGNVTKQVTRTGWKPFGVACDVKSSAAWVASTKKALYRIPLEGDAVQEWPIPAVSVAVGPLTDSVWVATPSDVIRLDQKGQVVFKSPLNAASHQSCIAAY